MKKYLSIIAIAILLFSSCKKDDTIEEDNKQQIKHKKIGEFQNGVHKLTLFSDDGNFYQGYNNIYVSVTDSKTNDDLSVDKMNFTPMMTMKMKMTFKHSCPHSNELSKSDNMYKGYSLFQMKTSKMGFWELNFSYTVKGKEYKIENEKVEVKDKKGLYSSFKKFKDSDENHYYLTIVDYKPVMGLNEDVKFMFIKVKGTGKVINGTKDLQFVTPKDYQIKMDPRMAGQEMGNHSSEGNINPKYQEKDDLFHASIGYSMGGNWTLNFIIEDKDGNMIAGSKVDCDLTGDAKNCNVDSKSTVSLEVDVPN